MARQTTSRARAPAAQRRPQSRAALERGRTAPAAAAAAAGGGAAAAAEPTAAASQGSGGKRFIGESWAELKKVEWPGQNQVIQGTVVVIIACVDRRASTCTSPTSLQAASSSTSSSDQ